MTVAPHKGVNRAPDDDGRTLLAWRGRHPASCPDITRLVAKSAVPAPLKRRERHVTSEERREARYRRRKEKRLRKKREHDAPYTFDAVASRSALAASSKECAKGVAFKASVKRFRLNELCNVATLSDRLYAGQSVSKGFICFTLVERGKARSIMSTHFSERVVQKALNQNMLVPVMMRSAIYDNGASRKGMGTSHAIKRLKVHLRRHYRQYGTDGYILLGDIHNYFGSMQHSYCKALIRKRIEEKRTAKLGEQFIDEYSDYHIKQGRPGNPCVGLGLGSEINQTMAVMYLNSLDHYIKEVLRIKGYQRFNDDFYLIHPDKEYLRYCLEEIRRKTGEIGLELNENKTHIVKLSHGFPYLKSKVGLTETGEIILRPARECVTRERRRLKRQAGLLEDGVLEFSDIRTSYASWKGSMKQRNSRRAVAAMDAYFNSLFIKDWNGSRREREA